MKFIGILSFAVLLSCQQNQQGKVYYEAAGDTINNTHPPATATSAETPLPMGADQKINTGKTSPADLLNFAVSLIGIPYKYGSIDPAAGFDCSGFITYVFNHFNIAVPRSSIDFTNVNRGIDLNEAKPGDIVLFTGTDSAVREVGHMGIVTSANGGEVQFIHSTSGKANGVTITPLNTYYKGRYVKTLRIFEQNDNNALF